MPQPTTFNPYGMIGAEMKPGLDAIIAAIPSPATATPDLLVTEVFNYISSVYYPSPSRQTEMQIKSVAYNVINSVRNSLVLSGNALFDLAQRPFIEMLIGAGITAALPAASFNDRIADIEDNVGTSDLNVNQQTALFFATTVGSNTYTYFVNDLARVTPSWASFYSANAGENYINTSYWGVEAMNGALAGYGATPQGLIAPTTDIVSVEMVSALIGALTAAAGKVMFKWIPRIVKPLVSGIEGGVPITGGSTAKGFFRRKWVSRYNTEGGVISASNSAGIAITGDYGHWELFGIRLDKDHTENTDTGSDVGYHNA